MKQYTNVTIYKHIGNFFIVLSILGFFYTFYPLFSAYFPQDIPKTIDTSSSLVIPKINAYSPIIKNVDPFNEKEYNQALQHGVAMAKGSQLPGNTGLTYLFAHSSGNPWQLTRFNTIFFRLGELEKGDEIVVYEDGRAYVYGVIDTKEVSPSEISYLLDYDFEGLILQTCTPIGTDLKRLLIFATLQ